MTEQTTAPPTPVPTIAPVGTAPPAPVFEPPAAAPAAREQVRRAHAAARARLSRLRLYSYCLTLAACVLALMSFMYLTQGTADGDTMFTGLGALFVALTCAALWGAIRVTRLGDLAT